MGQAWDVEQEGVPGELLKAVKICVAVKSVIEEIGGVEGGSQLFERVIPL